MKKQIWYTWDGDTNKDMSFIKDVKGVLFADGFIFNSPAHSFYRKHTSLWNAFDESPVNITAYTLGETK